MKGRFVLPRECVLAALRDAYVQGRFALPREFISESLREMSPTRITEKGAAFAPGPEFVSPYQRDSLVS